MAPGLLLAAETGNLVQVARLVEAGSNLQEVDNDGRTALHLAAMHNHLNVVQYLLGKRALVDAKMSDDGTPIFDAVAAGHGYVVWLLLQADADPYCVDDSGMNLLHWAVSEGEFDIARLLVERHPALKTMKANSDRTPIDFAQLSEDEDMINLFAEHHQVVTVQLTRDEITNRINTIFGKVFLNKDYYKGLVPETELHLMKWKTYIYLRKCVLDYRHGAKEELLQVIRFLEEKPLPRRESNITWFTKKLLDASVCYQGEQWGSGSHEWLERKLIIDVLKRSAGMVPRVEAEATLQGIQIDWLYIQAIIRSPTKYIFLRLNNGVLREGHPGAVKDNLNKNAFCSVGSPLFHNHLEQAFNRSHSITSFIIRAHNVFKTDLISGKKPIVPDNEFSRFVVNGMTTNDPNDMRFFQTNILRPNGYDATNDLFTTAMNNTATKPLEDYSEPPIDSESTEEDYVVYRR